LSLISFILSINNKAMGVLWLEKAIIHTSAVLGFWVHTNGADTSLLMFPLPSLPLICFLASG